MCKPSDALDMNRLLSAREIPHGWAVVWPQESPWQSLSPGILALTLDDNGTAKLIDFAPGAPWDGDHDASGETLLILDGGLYLGIADSEEIYVTAGSMVRAGRGTRNHPCAGPEGCRLLAFREGQALNGTTSSC